MEWGMIGDMPRNVWVLSGIALAVAVGFGVVAPVLPMFATSFGANEFAAGAVIAAFALMRFVWAPVVGKLDDRFGHRLVLLSGLLIVAASSALAGLARNYLELIVLRGIGGIGSAMFSVAGMTVLLASVDAGHRGRASGLYQGGFLVGAVLGPAIGGVFATISIRAPFFFYAGTLVVAAVVALGLQRVNPDLAGSKPAEAKSVAEIFADKRFQAACTAHLVNSWNSNGTRSTLVPLFIAAYLTSDTAQAALLSGVAMAFAAGTQIALVMPSGYLVDRFGRKLPMIAGALIAGAALLLVPWAGHIVALTAALCLYAAGSALLGTAPSATVGDVGGDRAIAIYSMTGDLGSIVGPLVAGALAASVGFAPAFIIGAGFWLVSAGMSLRMGGQPESGSPGRVVE
jgi:MFS family permease